MGECKALAFALSPKPSELLSPARLFLCSLIGNFPFPFSFISSAALTHPDGNLPERDCLFRIRLTEASHRRCVESFRSVRLWSSHWASSETILAWSITYRRSSRAPPRAEKRSWIFIRQINGFVSIFAPYVKISLGPTSSPGPSRCGHWFVILRATFIIIMVTRCSVLDWPFHAIRHHFPNFQYVQQGSQSLTLFLIKQPSIAAVLSVFRFQIKPKSPFPLKVYDRKFCNDSLSASGPRGGF